MAASFFFYDIETSGFDPRQARIMQFAGQRTDMQLQPIGEPVNHLIKLTPDVLPDPDAVLVTGITPQQTLSDGLTEAEFLKIFCGEIVQPDTIFTGYNSVRFDDEFMRFLLWRNFYDPYEWHWQDSCSRWDLLDVVRMTRALRPDGIQWPFAPDGKPTNRLEYITKLNKLSHDHAHDALSDVYATIAVARLLQQNAPKLFTYLLDMRGKREVKKLVMSGKPFVYTSGKYPGEYEKTTAAIALCEHPENTGALVYNLRVDPDEFTALSPEELAERWQWTRDESAPARLPVKTLKFNHCPAVAPMGVLREADAFERLQIDVVVIRRNMQKLLAAKDFVPNLLRAREILDSKRAAIQTAFIADEDAADSALYEDFIDKQDKAVMRRVRTAAPGELLAAGQHLRDRRLKQLLPLYKARNYPDYLTDEERTAWDAFCYRRLQAGDGDSRLAKFAARLQALAADPKRTNQDRYLLEELQLYAESIVVMLA